MSFYIGVVLEQYRRDPYGMSNSSDIYNMHSINENLIDILGTCRETSNLKLVRAMGFCQLYTEFSGFTAMQDIATYH